MSEEELAERVAKLFDDIYGLVSERLETRETTRLRLSKGMKGRMKGREALPERDIEEFLRVRMTQALPKTAIARSREISGMVDDAFGAWLEFVKSVEEKLEEAGLDWDAVFEAADLFLKGPKAVKTFTRSNRARFSDYLRAASIAKTTSHFNIYSIPMCLKAIFPYVKPEKARDYLIEARRAFCLIALARLKEMYDRGEWDELVLRRLSFMRSLVG